MAGAGAVIAGILAGGAAVGGTLVAIDPLGARKPSQPLLPDEITSDHILAWSDGTLPTLAATQGALVVLGYSGDEAISNFQGDTNEIRTWIFAALAGEERVPAPETGFTQIPVALQGMMPPEGAEGVPGVPVTGQLDQATVEALGQAIRAVVLASGTACMTEAGEAVEADANGCLQAWRQAFMYAYEANLAAQGPEADPGPPLGEGGPPSLDIGFRI